MDAEKQKREVRLLNELLKVDRGNLYRQIYSYVKTFHSGRQKAIKTKRLLTNFIDHLREHNVLYPDFLELPKGPEDLRIICSKYLPLCSCRDGVFYPLQEEDFKEFNNWLRSRAFAIFERIDRLKKFHADIFPPDPQQDLKWPEDFQSGKIFKDFPGADSAPQYEKIDEDDHGEL